MDADQPASLLLCRSAPGQDDALPELLDMALTLAVFGQSVTLLFLGDGVRHLVAGPVSSHRDSPATLATLADYGIQAWADESALAEAGIDARQLPVSVSAIAPSRIAALLAGAQQAWGW